MLDFTYDPDVNPFGNELQRKCAKDQRDALRQELSAADDAYVAAANRTGMSAANDVAYALAKMHRLNVLALLAQSEMNLATFGLLG